VQGATDPSVSFYTPARGECGSSRAYSMAAHVAVSVHFNGIAERIVVRAFWSM
jgi:hypothetical protein